jgi:hypothetical protein
MNSVSLRLCVVLFLKASLPNITVLVSMLFEHIRAIQMCVRDLSKYAYNSLGFDVTTFSPKLTSLRDAGNLRHHDLEHGSPNFFRKGPQLLS